jgi:hypothetical protein
LSKALGITENELLGLSIEQSVNYPLIKVINLSSLPFVIVPPINIVAPLFIMYRKKEINTITKQIVSLQILWTLLSLILFLISPFLNRIFSVDFPFILIVLALAIAINIYMIVQNAASIDKHKRLRIKLNFSFL